MTTRPPQRRLSVRRGSVSAPDPLGERAAVNGDPNRSTCSKLIIVRVVDPAVPEPPLSPGLHHRRSSRRHGNPSSQSGNDSRLSFALSSFAPGTSPTQARPPSPSVTTQNQSARAGSSPSSSPRLRPSSPSYSTRRHSTSSSPAYLRPNLSPEQLVELARQSHSPRFVPQGSHPASSPTSSTPNGASPATFTPLPPDVYLPFIDRPSEVTTLLSTPPTVKLFSLLAQTFPQRGPESHEENVFTTDPSSWSFEMLRLWLTTIDRAAASDSLWVGNARKCILAHSELIWERLKGALGVPPELELEEDEYNGTRDHATSGAFSSSETESAKDEVDPLSSPHTCFQTDSVTIEPIIATPSANPSALSAPSNPPPLSLGASLAQSTSMTQGDGLQDIGEEGEEEENVDDNTPQQDSGTTEPEAQIHGLTISTDPVPSSPARVSFGLSLPSSPAISSPVADGNAMELELPISPLRCRSRADSRGSVSNYIRPTSWYVPLSASSWHYNCDGVGDRVPGNPIFPSNFARLALGPTLRANNPSLRSSHPAPTFPRFARWRPGGRPPSWIEGWDSVKHEYAATVASGSSVGVGGGE
ncbi:hypothetical protein EDC04DRAFT_3116902 [Pisolithus marmoratus]|nr:hypothetical protein EDC04DRAFT_3116902 [Pisolithus marmoratus]